MAQSVVAAEAKLVVSLDTAKAEADLKKLAAQRPEGAPDEAAKGPEPNPMARPRQGPDTAYDPSRRGRELWRRTESAWNSVSGGRLYEDALAFGKSIGTPSPFGVPIPIGPSVAVAEKIQQYGPQGAAFAAGLLEQFGMKPEDIKVALDLAHTFAEELDSIKARLNAVGPAIDAARAVGIAKARIDGTLAPTDIADMNDFGMRIYEVERLFTEVSMRKKRMMDERLFEGMGSLLGKLFPGNAGK